MTEQAQSSPQTPRRLSVPVQPKSRSLALSNEQRGVLRRIADLLVPGTDADPSVAEVSNFDSLLDVAVLARGESFEDGQALEALASHR